MAKRDREDGFRPESPDHTVVIIRAGSFAPDKNEAERFLEWEFVRWAWNAGFPTWTKALRSLATTLRGLQDAGLVERERLRRAGIKRARHVVRLTRQGECVLQVLGGGTVPEDAQ